MIELSYCLVTPEDTLDWWNENDNIFTKRGSRDNGYASGDGRFFLFGWDEGNGDSGSINGTATLRNLDPPITKVIFPIVNGQAKTPEFAAEEMRKTDGAFARIRRVLKDGIVVISIPKEFRYRVPAHSIRAETAEPYYDGFWVCIEAASLVDGDVIEFGGYGPVTPHKANPYSTNARYKIVK